jgi:amidohydrolase
MTRDDLKQRVSETIERHADEIVAVGEAIRRHPELGFKELRTSALVETKFRQLGLAPRTGLAITGVRADAAGGAGPGPTFALVGELDALVVAGHPEADRSTGAVHACGHNAQIAGLIGAAIGLLRAKAMERLAGRVAFMAVPAEEGGDLEWRLNEVRAGRLEFLGGKCELLRLGHLDDVDLAMMIHTTARHEDGVACVAGSNNGRFGKTARFIGRAAHAGGAPHMGVNALYAAQLALAAINALRETFRDEDTIRVHPVLTHGGSQVNVIPGEARLETYVRGRTLEGIRDANAKVDRALKAGALALGASVEIETLPGYLPLRSDPTMTRLFQQNADTLFGAGACREAGHRTGSTDMGDLSQVIPGAPSVHGWRARHGPRRRLRDRRPPSRVRDAGAGHGCHGRGPPLGWGWQGSRGDREGPARDDSAGLRRVPAERSTARGISGRRVRDTEPAAAPRQG